MKKLLFMLLYSGLVFFLFCCTPEAPPAEFLARVQQIEDQFAPDKRIRVFQVDYKYQDGKWVISGETSVPEIKSEIEKVAGELFGQNDAVIELVLLPEAELAGKSDAVVDISVGNLRKQPKHGAEMVDQVLMGTRLKLLKKKGSWNLVQTPYEYIGWITSGSIVKMSAEEADNWQKENKIEITTSFCQVFEKPSETSPVVADLVLNCVLVEKSVHGDWVEVVLAGGRSGYVKKTLTREFRPEKNDPGIDRAKLVLKARSLMGVPYLWGGNSAKGLDCSGFTSTVFCTFGYQLPRDANMQVALGEEITPAEDWTNVLPGDLVFFGSENRITHVAISLGGATFIHSSDYVQINSLDENDKLFDEHRKRTFRKVKRLIEN